MDQTGYGLIGCGAFGLFCLKAYSSMPEVRLTAVADAVPEYAQRAAAACGAPAMTPKELLERRDVQIVHIATPPSAHAELALAALRAGKHLLCEKPLSVTTARGREVLNAAAKANRIAPVNFVLRYNPIVDAVGAALATGVVGKVLSARLTNCATDGNLPPDHWFWDRRVSGGIFIEHGVHFFDLYDLWFGPAMVASAMAAQREGTSQEDRVQCTVLHNSGVIASHYHGFDQPSPLDRTRHRLVCEMGDIWIDGWIPMSAVFDALVDDDGLGRLRAALGRPAEETLGTFEGSAARSRGRGKPRHFTRRVRLTLSLGSDKLAVYAQSLRDLLGDQLAFIRDRARRRRVVESNGLESLMLAEAAATMAQRWSGG